MRALAFFLLTAICYAGSLGPDKGSLVIVGGGTLGPEIVDRFIALAGGKDARFIYVPTADGQEKAMAVDKTFLAKAGCKNVTILHTKDRAVANSKEFIEPIRHASAVWFGGGRQWILVDSYKGTATEKEFWKVLNRGGVIGGTSAGATIQGSYLVRGAREGNTIMMAPGYEAGLGFLKNAGIDQHLIVRKRENDMLQVIDAHPKLLGIGIDESTAVVVHRNQFEVIGASKVAIYDKAYAPAADGKRYYFLVKGDKFDLKKRHRL